MLSYNSNKSLTQNSSLKHLTSQMSISYSTCWVVKWTSSKKTLFIWIFDKSKCCCCQRCILPSNMHLLCQNMHLTFTGLLIKTLYGNLPQELKKGEQSLTRWGLFLLVYESWENNNADFTLNVQKGYFFRHNRAKTFTEENISWMGLSPLLEEGTKELSKCILQWD